MPTVWLNGSFADENSASASLRHTGLTAAEEYRRPPSASAPPRPPHANLLRCRASLYVSSRSTGITPAFRSANGNTGSG